MEIDKFDKKPYKNFVITVVILILFSFIIIMINQVAQLINLASGLNPIFGKILIAFFSIMGLVAVISLILILVKMEKPLMVPDESNEIEYARYLCRLRNRLIKNKYLKKTGYVWDNNKSDNDSINEALIIIDKESQKILNNHASAVFTTTAISQNGSLDSVFVFVTAVKLVWHISMLYNQRPAISDLLKLYSNVFATVLIARQIDDIDLVAEQIEPIVSTTLGGAVGKMVPGVGYIVSFVVDSVLEGSLNTLLMLRIGFITQNYCRSITKVEPKTLGRTATIQSCKVLGTIITNNSKMILKVSFKAIKNATKNSVSKASHILSTNFDVISGKNKEEVAVTEDDLN